MDGEVLATSVPSSIFHVITIRFSTRSNSLPCMVPLFKLFADYIDLGYLSFHQQNVEVACQGSSVLIRIENIFSKLFGKQIMLFATNSHVDS